MGKSYVGVWAVFDEDYEEGLEKAFKRYKEAGINHIMYAGVAHTFDVHDEYYKNTIIDPWVQINYEKTQGDLFGTKVHLINANFEDINNLAKQYDLNLELNITPGVSEAIVRKYPSTAVTDIRGEKSEHWMCLSNPDVKEYFYGRIKDILEHYKGFEEVELDVVALDFYDPQVVPDWVLPELYPLRHFAIGNCFCEHCLRKAREAGLEINKIKEKVNFYYKEATTLNYNQFKKFDDTMRCMYDPMRFFLKNTELMEWLKFRAGVVEDFVAGCNQIIKDVDKNILLSSDLVSPSFSWTIGQVYHNQPKLTDITKLMLYHKTIGSFEVKPLKKLKQTIPEISESELLSQYYRLKGFSGALNFEEFENNGIDVENIYYEVKKAKTEVGEHPIIIGIGGDSPATPNDVKDAVKMAYEAGADGYMLHLWYHNAPKENIVAFGEQLKELGIV